MKYFKFVQVSLGKWYVYELIDDKIVFKSYKLNEIKRRLPFDFHEKIYKVIKDWENKYINPNIFDGLQWELNVILENGKEIKARGSNKYPDNYDELTMYLDKIIDEEK